MSGQTTHATPQRAAPIRRVSARTVQRCGGTVCPPGTCSHSPGSDADEHATLSRKAAGPAARSGQLAPPSVRTTLAGSGQPLDAATATTMGQRLGHDFTQVRVHADAGAAESAASVHAQAYTVGSHIVMGRGAYEPTTSRGQRLLMHELAHVVQQSGAATGGPLRISDEGDPAEREADAVASSGASRQLAPVAPHVARQVEPPEARTHAAGAELGGVAAGVAAAGGAGGGGGGTRTTRTFRVVLKSFIRVIGSAIGHLICPVRVTPTQLVDPFGVSVDAELALLAAATDIQFHETAPTDVRDNAYRLYSARDFTVTCDGGVPVSISGGPIDTDNGHEGPLETPPLIVYDRADHGGSSSPLHFSWSAKGRPNLLAEPTFQAICLRLSRYIWHHVEGEVDCSGVRLTSFSGSHFPTHRVYVDGAVSSTIPQGVFANLWHSGSPVDMVA